MACSVQSDQVLLLNNDTPPSRLCFVCDSLLTNNEHRIVDSETSCSRVPLACKLGDVVGNEFCIIVSKFDEICEDCVIIINQVDELEHDLEQARKKLLHLLQAKYNITFNQDNDCIDDTCVKSGDEREITSEQLTDSSYLNQDVKIKCEKPADEMYSENNSVENIFIEPDVNLNQINNDKSNDVSSPLTKVKDSIDSNIYVLTSSKDDEGKFVLCEYCSCFFSVSELEEHVEKCHRTIETVEVSVDSSEVFIDNPIAEEVYDSKVSYIVFKCGVCDYCNEDKEAVTKHLQTMHEITCELCGSPFDKISSLLTHYKSHGKSEGVCICKICEMPFPNQVVLSRHLAVHKKSEGPVTCQICAKVCHDNLHALYHRRNEHAIIQDLSCGLCNAPMESQVELKHHILMFHRGKKEYKCKKCDETFSRQLQYENHCTYAHGNSECRFCGKHIENVIKLRQHELRHARIEAKKFECDVCHKIFKTPGGLKLHSVSHTGKYKFFCEFCGRGFMSNVILEEHKGVHTKEERYVCDICGRKFVLYSTFHLHRQWHKNPYPFPCKMCDRKFRYRSERSNHVRRDHTGETPYKCDYCEAAFIKLCYLKKHLVMHTQVYPHTCHICDKGYEQKKALARHYDKVHNDPTLLQSFPKTCEYKVALRPEEYPEDVFE